MKYLFCLVLITSTFCSFTVTRANELIVVDSVGVERVGDKIFVLHRVNSGQTMFAVVRQYGVTIQALRDANPGMKDQIQSGQTIRVPYTPKVSKRDSKRNEAKAEKNEAKAEVKEINTEVKPEVKENKPAEKPVESVITPATSPVIVTPAPSTSAPSAASAVSVAPNGIHRVEAGQTLYRVAVKYGVLMADIRKWNNLTDDNLKDGQELIVTEKAGEKSAAPVVTPHVVPKAEVENEVKDAAKDKETVPEKVVKPVEEVVVPKVNAGKRKSEAGLAEVIETDESTSKFLGLHRTAPIGALVEVLNEFNQEKIIVRVIGRIPDTSINDDIVIKLSSRAFEKVSPNSKRFRAIVSYLDNN